MWKLHEICFTASELYSFITSFRCGSHLPTEWFVEKIEKLGKNRVVHFFPRLLKDTFKASQETFVAELRVLWIIPFNHSVALNKFPRKNPHNEV